MGSRPYTCDESGKSSGAVSRQNSMQTLGTIDSCTRNQPWNGFSAAEGTRTDGLSCEAVPRRSQGTWQIYFSRRSNAPTLRDVQRISSGCQIVTMMKTSEPWHRCNLATDTGILICLTPAGRPLRGRETRSVFMVITNVFADQAFQMPFVENNHTVKQVPPAIANQRSATPFCHGLRKLVRVGWMPKLFTVSITSSLKFAPRSKIKYLGAES